MVFVSGGRILADANNDRLLVDPTRIIEKLSAYRWLTIVVALLGGIAGYTAVKYEVGARPTFTSSTDIRILPSRAELVFARESLGGNSTAQTTALVRTFKELIRSDNVIRSALDELPGAPINLHHNTRTGCSTSDLINGICAAIGQTTTADLSVAPTDSLGFYRDAIAIDDIEGSFIMRLTVSLPDSQTSAEFANALIEAYNREVVAFDDTASARIGDAYHERLTELEADYAALLDKEIAFRESIGALSLEGDIARLQNTLQTQTAALNADQIDLVALERRLEGLKVARAKQQVAEAPSAGPSAPGTAASLAQPIAPVVAPLTLGSVRLPTQPELIQADIDALDVQIAERQRIIETLRGEIEEATRKQIMLRPIVTEQATILNSIGSIKATLFAPSTTNVASAATAVVLREAGAPDAADPPSAIQAGLVGGAGGLILMSLILALIALVTAPRQALAVVSATPAPDPQPEPAPAPAVEPAPEPVASVAPEAEPDAKNKSASAVQSAAKAARKRSTKSRGGSSSRKGSSSRRKS